MKVVIIGGVAGGASAAARLRRLDEKTEITGNLKSTGNVLIEGRFHGEVEATEAIWVEPGAQSDGQLRANDAVISGAVDGEIWFKIDRGTAAGFETINRIGVDPARALAALDRCATLAPTWVQTCWFALDGRTPGDAEESAYVELLRPVAEKIKGVHLYGLARPSLQPDAPRLGRLPEQEMAAFAARISALGVEVSLNP